MLKYFTIFAVVFTFLTPFGALAADTTPPVISNVRVENIITTGAQIKWGTDDGSDTRVPFGLASGHQNYTRWVGNESDRCDGGGYAISHCINLTGLTSGTTYYFKVESKNSDNYDTHYGECSFVAGSGSTAYCTSGSSSSYDPSGNLISGTGNGYSGSGSSGSGGSGSTSGIPPTMPSGLTAVLSDNYLNVNLTWTDNAEIETFFDLFYKKSGESYSQYFATVSANTVYYVHMSAPAGGLEYTIKACNSSGCSPDSNAASITVPESVKKITGNVTRQDGRAVTDASINVRNTATDAYVYGQADSSGNYSISLSGGNWEVSIYPNSTSADWVYNQPPQTVVFASDTTIETKTLNFAVTTTDAIIKGRIVKPDGTALLPEMVSLWLQGSSGSGFGGPIDTAGYFSVAVPAGTYHIYINISDPQYSAPSIPDPTVVTGETKDLGTITLISATKTIKGKVTRADASPIADAKINVYIPNGVGRETQTDSAGNYTITVVGGSWEMYIYPATDAANWYYDGPSKSAVFVNDSSVEEKIVNFVVTTTDSEIQGQILKPDGSPPASKTVSLDIRTSGGQGVWAGVDDTGRFRAKVAAGTYNIYINVSDPLFVAPTVSPVTVISGTTKDLGIITLANATKTIKGSIKRADGSAITDANVNAWQQDTGRNAFAQVDGSGNFSLSVVGGYWQVMVNPNTQEANWVYSDEPKAVSFADDSSTETKTADFIVTTVDAKITGKVLKPDGTTPARDSVHIELESPDHKFFFTGLNSDGSFSANIPSGVYKVHIRVNDPLYAAPEIADITITAGATKDVGTITLVKAAKTIKGKVSRRDGSAVTDAGINVYQPDSGRGTYAETDSSGNYTIGVTGGYWEIYIYPKSSSANWAYNEQSPSILFANDSSVEEKIINFTVITTDAAVIGKVLKPDGQALTEGQAFVDLHTSAGPSFGGQVTANGSFKIAVPAGTYEVSLWIQDQKFAAPAIGAVTVSSGQTKDLGTITLVQATKIIKGKITSDDGRAVTDAGIGAYRKETQSWIGSKVDAGGNYALQVLGGSWEIGIHPVSIAPDWTYNKPPELVVFALDSTVEERILNFMVLATNAKVIGKVVKPDGQPPASNKIFVGLRSSEGFESGGPVSSDGSFSIAVVAGTYNLAIHSDDPTLKAPQLPPITVLAGETRNLGQVTLETRSDHIKGKVTDATAVGIANIEVNAWQPDGVDHAFTQTDTSGSYDLLISAGRWEVSVFPDPATDLYNPEPPKQIKVLPGITATVNFTLAKADAGISGTVVNGQGNVLSDLYGFVDLSRSSEFNHAGLGGPVDRGQFSFKAPSGTYSLSVFLPPDSPYTSLDPQTVTLMSGQTTSVTVKVSKNSSIITGTLRDQTGKAITGIDAKIFATSQKGSWQEAIFDKTTGVYKLRVASGTWYLGLEIDPTSGFLSLHEPNIEVIVGLDQTITKNLVAAKAGSIIKGQVTDPDGKAVFGAFVGISKTSFSGLFQGEGFKDPIVAGAETDAAGQFTIAVPFGTYYIKTFVHPERGFINSDEQNVTVADGETKIIGLKLKRADLAITGKVFIEETVVDGAFISGWSAKGGYQETFSELGGSFRLNVTSNDVWTITAGYEKNGVFYKSGEVALKVETVSVSADLHLVKFVDLPPTVVKTSEAAQTTRVETFGGASVVAPANSISTSGQVNISVAPNTQTPTQGEIKVVGIAYDLEARDESGRVVSAFNTALTVSIPYDEAELLNIGASENNLVMSFWDETAGTWKTLGNSVVNKEENVVTAAVDHFTRFAIVAAADITPPEAPTKVTANALGQGEIKLAWINPLKDFDHVKVYRSATSTVLGAVAASDVKQASYVDTGIIDGRIYYYTVRSVDPAGNESANTEQVSVAAIGTSAKKIVVAPIATTTATTTPTAKKALPPGQARKLEIFKNLTQGDFGEDIKTLQQLLLDEGVYPEGLITGFFGTLTRQAVIRFQEKYAPEILKPVGLTNGTGFVGPGTLKKVNELLSGAASAKPMQKTELPPGQAVKSAILRNLSQGIEGEDVKTLQQLLIDEGVYPEGLITGFFGFLTKQAVIRFQEKYINEILTPAGLTNGTGYVGAGTRKKIEELLK